MGFVKIQSLKSKACKRKIHIKHLKQSPVCENMLPIVLFVIVYKRMNFIQHCNNTKPEMTVLLYLNISYILRFLDIYSLNRNAAIDISLQIFLFYKHNIHTIKYSIYPFWGGKSSFPLKSTTAFSYFFSHLLCLPWMFIALVSFGFLCMYPYAIFFPFPVSRVPAFLPPCAFLSEGVVLFSFLFSASSVSQLWVSFLSFLSYLSSDLCVFGGMIILGPLQMFLPSQSAHSLILKEIS